MSQEDEDNDICPVCDGECTCANKPRPVQTTSTSTTNAIASSSRSSAFAAPVASSSAASSAVTPKLPSLKIRLTIPPNMLGKRLPNFTKSKVAKPTTSASAAGGGTYTISPHSSAQYPSPYAPVPKKRGRPPKALSSARHLGTKSSNNSPFYHPSQPIRKRKPTVARKPAAAPRIPPQLKGKGTNLKKLSAAKRRRAIDYSSSSSSSSESDIDPSPFHYDNDDSRSIQFPTFVSASALSSSSDSDAESSSGFDTDSSMEAEEESFIVAEDQAAQKARVRRELLGDDGQKRRNPHNDWVIRPRKRSVGPSDVEMQVDTDATEDEDEEEEDGEDAEDDDETDELPVGSGYIGLATGWSEEDEESSFDADLFFANLTDSEDGDGSSSTNEHDERGEEGDQSDLDSDVGLAGLLNSRLRHDLQNLPFELMEGWDGQVIFSNGLGEGRSALDADFEVTASVVDTSASPSQESDNGDEMETEEDDFEGDTTDEELVGEDQLPNERAMRLFNLPFSVSSINPMSTMSPSGSPAPRNRRPFGSQGSLESPKPADILSGRFLEDLENPADLDEDDMAAHSESSRGAAVGPRTGVFTPGDTMRAIIDDTHASVLSPHPRARGRRGKSASHFGRTSPRYIASRPMSLPPISQPSFQLLSSSELTTSPELSAQTFDLDDVLDSAFLDSEPPEAQVSASPVQDSSSHQHLNLSRWGWGSDTPGSSTDFENALRNSPMSSMMWQDKDGLPLAKSGSSLRARDGDRTPTNAHRNPPPPQQEVPVKSRKETRRERKMKQKNMGLGHERPPHQQHYFRQHHPNSKTRSTSSSQRTNFFNNSPPAPNF
ncbi:hypothetical protein R3P38DRAFT_3187076 [Favolaschia claudopus]|uniref:Uncharacterized protein n=1 Tax=Favolaschia claudopus TaxID=2862362 RepID=A0AAW0BZ55_9AGAR